MENSFNFGLFLLLYFAIFGLILLLNPKQILQAMNDLLKSKGQVMLAGVLALIFGLVIVSFHGYYQCQWPLIITIIGWLSLIKGVAYLVCADTIKKFAGFYQSEKALRINGVFCLLFACVFVYFLYF